MKYKIVYVSYMTSKGSQKQIAYISKAEKNVNIASSDGSINSDYNNLNNVIKYPLISVEFYKTYEEAKKEAMKWCKPDNIFDCGDKL